MELKKRRAIIIAINKRGSTDNNDRLLEELELLLSNLGIDTVDKVIQSRVALDPAFMIGYGKAQFVRDLCRGLDADLVVCNSALSPKQKANLKSVIKCEIWDRSFVIMKIFEKRARTSEAKLQVELAQCRYELPHLKGFGHQMSRLGGGIGTRGPGETEFEKHRRKLERRVKEINKKMKQVKSRREAQRKRRSRSGVPVVAMVGYTNSGKSTLIRRLSGDQDIEVANVLFATLDTLIRNVKLPSGKSILLADTVGFIRNLPPSLIAAFKTTLEEAVFADYILLVTDVTDPEYMETLDVVRKTLSDIGAGEIPRAVVLNKIDLLDKDMLVRMIERLKGEESDIVATSALNGHSITELLDLLEARCDLYGGNQ